MAVTQFSGIGVVDLNGSIGTTTFSRNAYGTYAKTRLGAPAGSPFLTAWQATIRTLVPVWQLTMTELERKAWYAISRISNNAMSRKDIITGFDLFMSVNLNRFLVGGGTITTPMPFDPTYQIKNVVVSDSTAANFTIDAVNPTTQNIHVCASQNLSPGRMSNTQIYASLGTAGGGIGPVSIGIWATYPARLGALIPGKKVFIRLTPIANSGNTGVSTYISAILT